MFGRVVPAGSVVPFDMGPEFALEHASDVSSSAGEGDIGRIGPGRREFSTRGKRPRGQSPAEARRRLSPGAIAVKRRTAVWLPYT
jgi:hypothetical protein